PDTSKRTTGSAIYSLRVADFGLWRVLPVESFRGGQFPAPELLDGRYSLETMREHAWVASRPSALGLINPMVLAACDQYSLAATSLALRTGQASFDESDSSDAPLQVNDRENQLGLLPGAEASVLRRALNDKPAERYRTCLDFVHELKKATQDAQE